MKTLHKELVALLIVLTLSVTLLLPIHVITKQVDVPKIGEVSKESVIAPFTFEVLKLEKEYEQEKILAGEKALAVFMYDIEITERVYRQLDSLRRSVFSASQTSGGRKEKKIQTIRKLLPEKTIWLLLRKRELLDELRYSVDHIMDRGVSSVYLAESVQMKEAYRKVYGLDDPVYLLYNKEFLTLIRDDKRTLVHMDSVITKEVALEREVKRLKGKYSEDVVEVLSGLLHQYITANIFYDNEETARAKEMEMARIPRKKGEIVKGTKIVDKNEVITSELREELLSLQTAYEKMNREKAAYKKYNAYFANLVLVGFIFFCTAYLARILLNSSFKNTRKLLVITSVFLIQILFIRLSMGAVYYLNNDFLSNYSAPYIAGTVIVVLLYGMPAGMLLNIIVGIFSGMVFGYDFLVMLYVFFTGSIAAIISGRIWRRIGLVKVFLVCLLTSVGYILCIMIIRGELDPVLLSAESIAAGIGCLLSILIAFLYKPLESLSGEITRLSLLEYSDINHPLMKRLSSECSGTFLHATNVANMAAAAAAAVHEDPNFTRLLAYYHDVGKTVNPACFRENINGGDVFAQTDISADALRSIIVNHVKEGVELAQKYGLPTPIQEAILQHHGTMPVAVGMNHAKSDIQYYPGPVPQNRVNAIVMFADMCEGFLRSGGKSSEEEIRSFVHERLMDIVSSGQLNACELTLQELEQISEIFIHYIFKKTQKQF